MSSPGEDGAAAPPAQTRPELTPDLSGAELDRWYWLRSELVGLARTLGVSTAGSKDQLAARIRGALDGEPEVVRPVSAPGHGRIQLAGELTRATVIPPGQRCSQLLRSFFVGEIGPAFRFDGPMRAFVRDNPGSTLGDALAHWWATRDRLDAEIPGQFELNRFTRRWYADHPGGSRADLLAAWQRYRATPTDARHRA